MRPPMVESCRRRWRAAPQTRQNHNFVASEHGPEAAEGGEGAAQRFGQAHGLFFFGLSERNKMTEVLLR